jgi:lauroyl/myristoyl acyltransferase
MEGKRRRFHGFDRLKGAGVRVLGFAMLFRRRIPRFVFRAFLAAARLGFQSLWFVPFNPWRSAVRSMLRIGGAGESPRRVFFRLFRGAGAVALGFVDAHRRGIGTVLPRLRFSPEAERILRDVAAREGRGILVLPHVTGGILSASLFSKKYPTTILSLGPRPERRAEIQRKFVKPLEIELLVLDRKNPVLVARGILSALKGGRFVVGTTDLNYRREDSIPARMFGQPVDFPTWPARFARQAKVPIIPGFTRVSGGGVEIHMAEPVREEDLALATQAWASAFERMILESPWEWAFLLDRRWGRVLRRAAAEGWRPPDVRP